MILTEKDEFYLYVGDKGVPFIIELVLSDGSDLTTYEGPISVGFKCLKTTVVLDFEIVDEENNLIRRDMDGTEFSVPGDYSWQSVIDATGVRLSSLVHKMEPGKLTVEQGIVPVPDNV